MTPFRSTRPCAAVVRGAVLATLLSALASCASVPPPDNTMMQAQDALSSARQAGAADYAPVDFGFAQDKYQQAQAAMSSREYAAAAQLADESRADAELARAKARLGGTRAKIQAQGNENARLREQLDQVNAQASAAASAAAQAQQQAQMQAQLQAQMQPADGSSSEPPPDGMSPQPAAVPPPLPDAAPLQDMPAPSSSVLSNPPPATPSGSDRGGFQSVPSDAQGNGP